MCTIRSNGHRIPVEICAGGKPTKTRKPLRFRGRRLACHRARKARGFEASRIGNFIADLVGIKRQTPRG